MDLGALQAVVAETYAKRDLTEITGPTDPDGRFGGRTVTLRRWRRDEVTNRMLLGGFVWSPFPWPVARTGELLSVWPVRAIRMEPEWVFGRGGRRVYQGQLVTLLFDGDFDPTTGPADQFVWQVAEFGQPGMTFGELCDQVLAAEHACFKAWCRVLASGRMPEPDVLVESQQELHAAAEQLRRLCLADPAAAELARRALMRAQVEGELKHDAAVGRRRTQDARQPIRKAWTAERIHIVESREALAVGLGWPHRGERVVVDVMRRESGGERRVSGPAVYMTSNDIYNVGHVVWVLSLGRARHESSQLIHWSPCIGDECADPAGDIGIRLEAAPDRRLPVPLARWPKIKDIDGGPDVEATTPDDAMVPLFGEWEVR